MLNAVNYIFFICRLNGFFNQRFMGVLDDPGDLFCPQGFECSFQLGEGKLDRVVPWRVRQVIYEPVPQLPHLLLTFLRDVGSELVHK